MFGVIKTFRMNYFYGASHRRMIVALQTRKFKIFIAKLIDINNVGLIFIQPTFNKSN